jgi:hypothetical protein
MERPTVDYIMKLGTCWKRADLERQWTENKAPDDITWSWFLGPRLKAFPRDVVLLRVLIAVQHISYQRIALPNDERAGSVYKRCKAMPDDELLSYAENLGVFLDTDPRV